MKIVTIVISCALVQLLLCWAAIEPIDNNQRSLMTSETLVRRDGLPSTSTSKRGDERTSRTDHQGNNAPTNQQSVHEIRPEPLIRRSSRSPAASSRSSSISAATPASSTISRSDWSELRHQKSWTTSESDSSSMASVNSHETKRTSRSRSGSSGGSSSKRTSTKSSRKSLGDLAIESHSSDSSDDSSKYNSMLHRARQMGFNIRTDGSLTSWPQLNHEAPNQYLRTPSRSPTHYRSLSPTSRSRHSDSHVQSDSETSSHSSRAHQR